MARLHPGDPPVQGPHPGLPRLRDAAEPIGPWSAERAPALTRPAPPPGAQLRSVRVEYAAIAIQSLALAAVLGASSLFVDVRDVGAAVASMVGAGIGVTIGAFIAQHSDTGPDARLRRPHVWPAEAIAEPSGRAFTRTVATMTAIEAAFVIVFVILSNPDFVVFYAGISVVLAAVQAFKYRRLLRIEALLGVAIYRSVSRFPKYRAKPQYFARTGPPA